MASTALFWDLGGTMVQTYPELDAALLEVAHSHGHPEVTPEEVSALTRISTGQAMAALAARTRVAIDEFQQAEQALKVRWRTDPPAAMPGAAELLDRVRTGGGINVVVTHRDRRSSESLLEQLGLVVEDMVCAPDGYPRKPDPTMYLVLLQRHQLDPAQCLSVGDRPIDAISARAAGIETVNLGTPGIPTPTQADHEIESLTELFDRFSRPGFTQPG